MVLLQYKTLVLVAVALILDLIVMCNMVVYTVMMEIQSVDASQWMLVVEVMNSQLMFLQTLVAVKTIQICRHNNPLKKTME